MNLPARLLYSLLLLCPLAANAQAPAGSPFKLDQQFSADQLITAQDGTKITNKIFMDGGRMRTEMNAHGMNMVMIVLPDEKKVYSIMPEQKMVMVMPYDPTRYKKQMTATEAFKTNFNLVGPDAAEGVACLKYKGVTEDGKTFFLWTDAVRHVPVKMAADDGSFNVLWKNYQAGPQDPALFQVPSGYQTMDMPTIPNMPGGAGGGPSNHDSAVGGGTQ